MNVLMECTVVWLTHFAYTQSQDTEYWESLEEYSCPKFYVINKNLGFREWKALKAIDLS